MIANSFIRYLYSLFMVACLSGCGQSGPLYLPDSPPPIYVPKQQEVDQGP